MCWYGWMSEERVVSARREIAAPAATIFELIADPARQPEWDGNDNLGHAPDGQRVRGVGDVFTMTLNHGAVRENHVVEFDEGRLIAWQPSEQGGTAAGSPLALGTRTPRCRAARSVTHTYDWTRLTDPKRLERARNTTADNLRASMDRLAVIAEGVRFGGNVRLSSAHVTSASGFRWERLGRRERPQRLDLNRIQ